MEDPRQESGNLRMLYFGIATERPNWQNSANRAVAKSLDCVSNPSKRRLPRVARARIPNGEKKCLEARSGLSVSIALRIDSLVLK